MKGRDIVMIGATTRRKKKASGFRKPMYQISDALYDLRSATYEMKDTKLRTKINAIAVKLNNLRDELDEYYNWD